MRARSEPGDDVTRAQITLAVPADSWVNDPPIAINDLDGDLCPMFRCAVCWRPVYSVPTDEHSLPGYVLWWDLRSPAASLAFDREVIQLGPFVVHRLDCTHELERRVSNTPSEDWGHVRSRPLSAFIGQLAYNTAHPVGTDPGDVMT